MMAEHPKIPKGYRKVRADSILGLRARYWNYGRRKWVQTQYPGYTPGDTGGLYIRPIKPKPKVKPRKKKLTK